jgi:hypothetical protein
VAIAIAAENAITAMMVMSFFIIYISFRGGFSRQEPSPLQITENIITYFCPDFNCFGYVFIKCTVSTADCFLSAVQGGKDG